MTTAVAAQRSADEPYRHLEDHEEILWGLGFRQLVYVLLGALLGIVFALYVSPLPPWLTLGISIIIAGLPVVLSLVASSGELAPWSACYALWRWWRSPKLYVPGANPVWGYHVPARREQEPQRPSRRGRDAARRLLEEFL